MKSAVRIYGPDPGLEKLLKRWQKAGFWDNWIRWMRRKNKKQKK